MVKTLLSLLFCVQFTLVFSQQDTEFWFAAPDISSSEGESPLYLNLSSYSNATTVTISQPANGAFTPIIVNLGANAKTSVDLTPFIVNIESPNANTVENTGIKIVSTDIISASYEVLNGNNREVFALKGQKALGTEFYTPFQKFFDNAVTTPATFSSIEIVATVDNTTIAITPRTDIVGHVANSTYTVILNSGQTYSARDVNVSAATTLAGSIVSADQPIAITLFTGAALNGSCTSTLGDQIVATPYLGNDFIIHKTKGNNERIYILATQNSTSISITNSTTTNTLINWSETYEYVLTDDINYIQTSNPVYIIHIGGNGCNMGMTQVPQVSCAGKFTQDFTRESSDSLGLIVHIRAGFESNFTLNGSTTLLQASDFNVVPGTSGEYVVALKYFNTSQIPVGAFNQLTNSGDVFGLATINGTQGAGSAYAYVSEFQSYPFVNAGTDATVCANSSINLNGIVGGGSVTGVWGSNGFGDWEFGLDTLTNIYYPSNLDTIISPINLILTSTGPCPVEKDTLVLTVSPAPIVNASVDQVVCANNANVFLNGTIGGGSSTGIWSSLGTGNFSPNNTDLNAVYIPSNADTVAGNVTLVLTSTAQGTCGAETDTMQIVITGSPIVNIPQDTIYVCSNNPNVSLTGTVGGGSNTGKWISTGTGLFLPDNLSLTTAYQPSPQDVNNGEIWIYLESTNNGNCVSVLDSVNITFTASPFVDAGVNQLVCSNDSEVSLSGIISGPTTTGSWSGGSGNFNPDNTTLNTIYSPTATELSSGSMILTLTTTNNGNCLAETDLVQIDFVDPPFANFNFNSVCQFDTTYFTDFSLNGFGSIVNWSWDFGDGATDFAINPNHIYTTNGSYDVQLIIQSSAGCFDTIVKSVNSFEKPQANFNYTSTCNTDQIIIDFNDLSQVGTSTINYWFYDFGGAGNQATQNPTQLFLGEGNFTITQIVQTIQGCSDTTSQILNVPPKPVAGFFYNTSNGLNIGATFEFIDTSIYATDWTWDLGNGETSTDQNPLTTYFDNGTYSVTQWATSALGCVDSVTVKIEINTVTKEISDLIPNAISPNGDGKNDVWKLEFIEVLYPDAEIVIVNRWGQTVFQSIGYPTPWDGRFNNEIVPEGTYYYVIRTGTDEVFEGTILVLISANN